jgi:hypothetical protein
MSEITCKEEELFKKLIEYWNSHEQEHVCEDHQSFVFLNLDDDIYMQVKWLPFATIGEVTSVSVENYDADEGFSIGKMPIKAEGFTLKPSPDGWFYKVVDDENNEINDWLINNGFKNDYDKSPTVQGGAL